MCVCVYVLNIVVNFCKKKIYYHTSTRDNTSGRCPYLAKVVNIINTLLFLKRCGYEVKMSGISFSIKKTEPSKVIKSQNAGKDEEKKDYVLELEGKEIKR